MHRKTLLNRIWAATIWGKDTIPEEDERVRPLLQVIFPSWFAFQIAFGLAGIVYGVPAIYTALDRPIADTWSAMVMSVAVICLVGAIFPRQLAKIDSLANSIFAMLQALYAGCLIYLAFLAGDMDGRAADRSALAVRAAAGLLLPALKAYDSARERKSGGK